MAERARNANWLRSMETAFGASAVAATSITKHEPIESDDDLNLNHVRTCDLALPRQRRFK